MVPSQVTVFGGSGFIGRYVVRRLARAGCRVVAAVRDTERAAFLRPMGDVGQIAALRCDVRDPATVARALQGSDGAVNLVGILAEVGRARFQALQAEAPGTVARAAAAAGVRALVQISAVGAAPDSPSAYARTKAAGEAAARAAFPDAVVLRPSVVFGPEDGFFNRFAALLRLGPVFPLFGGGRNKFQPVYVGDVAEAVFAALTRPDLRGRTFELGGPRVYTMREVLELTLRETGRDRVLLPMPLAAGCALGMAGNVLARLGIAPPLTTDQVKLLRIDNVAAGDGLAALGIRPTAVEAVVPTYLDRFRPTGRFRAHTH